MMAAANKTKPNKQELSHQEALDRVARALAQIQYGEIVIKIQAGKVQYVDKFERERVG